MASVAGTIHAGTGRKRLVYRHFLPTRITHWINALAIFVLLGTGLNILMAHPRLYWGHFGSVHDTPWIEFHGDAAAGKGSLRIGSVEIGTTGLIGYSGGQVRAFPSWATIPGTRDLATARSWHFLFAWTLILNGIAYYLFGLWNRHIMRDMVPTKFDISPKNIWQDFVNHLAFNYPKGEDSLHYHPMQKIAYFSVIAVLVPGIIATGLCMSPGADSVAPWIVDLFGGRQSARTIHFLCAMGIVGFIIVHVSQVLLAGAWNEIRSMVTGKWAIEEGR